MSAVFEAKARPGPLERLICRLSIKTAEFGDVGGRSVNDLETCDFAAMLASLRDVIGRELGGVMAEDPGAIAEAVRQLDLWGWNQYRNTHPKTPITPKSHALMALAAIREYMTGEPISHDDLREFTASQAPLPHWQSLRKRVLEAEEAAIRHIARQLRDD